MVVQTSIEAGLNPEKSRLIKRDKIVLKAVAEL